MSLKDLKESLPNLHVAEVSQKELYENTIHEDPRKLGCVGASEVGKLFTKAGLKAKTAHTFAYEKALELINGYRDFINTNATLHGINSELDGYRDIILPKYPNALLRSDISIFLVDKEKYSYWATPDVTDDSVGITIDIKCPYTPYTYWNNVNSLPNQYKAQNQMQMIGTGHKKGAICLYLTSDKIDEYGNKKEYNIPKDERSCFIQNNADEEFQNEIHKRIDGFFPMRDLILKGLEEAPELSDEELFRLCKKMNVKKFKENSNLLTWNDSIIKCDGEHYTYKES
ncbi:MAG: recombinase [Bacteroidota bacterium]